MYWTVREILDTYSSYRWLAVCGYRCRTTQTGRYKIPETLQLSARQTIACQQTGNGLYDGTFQTVIKPILDP